MRCFFHLVRGSERIADGEGVEVESLKQAILDVDEVVREFAAASPDESPDWQGWSFEVTDVAGKILLLRPLEP
jgi:hypothetical protein